MSKLNFFTAITYQGSPKSIASFLLEKVDDYFYLGGKKAHVIQARTKTEQEKVILSEAKSSLLARVGKVLSYFTIVIPLCMLIAKVTLRSMHSFKLIDLKQNLEKGINISEDTASKIKELMPKILGGQKDDDIEWLSTGNNLVFKLAQHPHLVVKIARPNLYQGEDKLPIGGNDKTDSRFENMVKAKKVCVTNGLSLLIIPHAKKLTVNVEGNEYALIVEESLDFDSDESAHEEFYHKYSTELNEAIRQLAVLVAKTGFNDVTWRNIPVITELAEFHGPRRVALIDLEHMESVKNGFLGDLNESCGLIRCVSEEQIDQVIAEAGKQGVALPEKRVKGVKNRRLKELEDDRRLRIFHVANGVVTGKEPIQVDLDSLDLDLNEKGEIKVVVDEGGKLKWEKQTVTLRKAAEDVIAEINSLIQNSSDNASTKGKRYFVLSTNKEPFRQYNGLGLPSSKIFFDEEEEKQLWPHRIIQALVDKNHIFKIDKVNGHGLFIQA